MKGSRFSVPLVHMSKKARSLLLPCLAKGQISCSLQCFYKSTSVGRVFQCDVTFRADFHRSLCLVCFVGHSVRTWTGTIFDRGLNSFAIYQWHFTLCICRLWTKCIPRTADSSERLGGVCQAAILNSIITKTGPCVL